MKKHDFEYADEVLHKAYGTSEVFRVIGFTETAVLISGDFSGGTNAHQSEWVNPDRIELYARDGFSVAAIPLVERLEPFDLKRAEAGEPVVTQLGKAYKYGAYNQEAKPSDRLVGWIRSDKDEWDLAFHDSDGKFVAVPNSEDLDLFMLKKEPEMEIATGFVLVHVSGPKKPYARSFPISDRRDIFDKKQAIADGCTIGKLTYLRPKKV